MIRMTRLTDYAVMLLAQFVRSPKQHSARDLARETRLPLPSVSKVLKLLARNGLLSAHRGVKGGFCLTRPPEEIRLTSILRALEGPIAITECSGADAGTCDFEQSCAVSAAWRRINQAVEVALDGITLADMINDTGPHDGDATSIRLDLASRTLSV